MPRDEAARGADVLAAEDREAPDERTAVGRVDERGVDERVGEDMRGAVRAFWGRAYTRLELIVGRGVVGLDLWERRFGLASANRGSIRPLSFCCAGELAREMLRLLG